MARRSDHTRAELEELILREGHGLLAEMGYARFSAREVAKRVGYTIGTIYNVFENLDHLILALNGRTYALWAEMLEARLARAGADRIAALVSGYFGFARQNRNLWMAIYEHRMPEGVALPAEVLGQRTKLLGMVEEEVAAALPGHDAPSVSRLTRSLVATVHGHCFFEINRTFEALGETDPEGAALARVREALNAAKNVLF